MQISVVTPPEPFIDLATAKKHLRVEGDDENTLINAYIAAACGHIDGPHSWVGRCVGEQTLLATFDEFEADLLEIVTPPLLAIDSVIYDDSDGVAQTIDEDLYSLDPRGVLLVYGETWPTPQDRAGAVRVQYTAGYEEVPAVFIAAALLLVGDLYQNRETSAPGSMSAIPMSATVESLLRPYRVVSI